MYRGHLARAVVVSNRRAELNIEHELLKLAEKYISDRDLPALLQAANQVRAVVLAADPSRTCKVYAARGSSRLARTAACY